MESRGLEDSRQRERGEQERDGEVSQSSPFLPCP